MNTNTLSTPSQRMEFLQLSRKIIQTSPLSPYSPCRACSLSPFKMCIERKKSSSLQDTYRKYLELPEVQCRRSHSCLEFCKRIFDTSPEGEEFFRKIVSSLEMLCPEEWRSTSGNPQSIQDSHQFHSSSSYISPLPLDSCVPPHDSSGGEINL